MKQRKLTMNIGIISFIVIFVILCLMTFAILSLSSAKSNAQSVENSINHAKQYYLLSSQGEKTLETIDNYLYINIINQVQIVMIILPISNL